MISDVFCKILKGELPADVVYRDDEFWVVKDIHPQAPVHLLVIPVKHCNTIADFTEGGSALLGRALAVAHKVAGLVGLKRGYRLIVNEGEHGGKLVPHFHIHLLGGKRLGPKIVND